MRFWTIQPQALWNQMKSGKTLRVDPNHPRYGGKRPWQYEWLSENLQRSCSGFDGGWPWWMACERPDLDQARSKIHPGGADQALIELELPEDRCTVFPLWMWETIHMGVYLALNIEELDAWHRELWAALPDREVWPLPEPWAGRLDRSWQRMFDREVPSRCWYRDQEPSEPCGNVQQLMTHASAGQAGLTQVLSASDVLDVVLFTALEKEG